MSNSRKRSKASKDNGQRKKKSSNVDAALMNDAPSIANLSLTINGCGKLLNFQDDAESDVVLVQILGVFRYIPSSKFKSQTGLELDEVNNGSSVYDIVLSDGSTKIKMLLAPQHGKLVLQGKIAALQIIAISKWTLHADELVEDYVNHIPILHDFETLQEADQVVLNNSYLTWHSSCKSDVQLPQPLVPGRELYLPLTCTSCLADFSQIHLVGTGLAARAATEAVFEDPGSKWNTTLAKATEGEGGFEGENHPTIKQILSAMSSTPVVGRVVEKSALQYFGKLGSNSRIPLKFEFVVSDTESEVSVVVWNRKCLEYYYAIQIGDVVMVSGHRVKSYLGQLELSINSGRKDEGSVTRLSDTQQARIQQDNLGDVQAHVDAFSIIELLHNLRFNSSENQLCNVLTVVQYAGPRQFVTSEPHKESDTSKAVTRNTDLSEHRMLIIRDHSSTMELVVRLFPNSQFSQYSSVQAGDILFLSHLTILYHVLASNYQPCVQLVSSSKTLIHRGFPPTPRFQYGPEDLRIKRDLTEWHKNNSQQHIQHVTQVGDSELLRDHPHPSQLRPFSKLTTQHTPWVGSLVAVEAITKIIAPALRVGQIHYCRVQGYISDVDPISTEFHVSPSQSQTPPAVLLEDGYKILIKDINNTVVLAAELRRDPLRVPNCRVQSPDKEYYSQILPSFVRSTFRPYLRKANLGTTEIDSLRQILSSTRLVFCLEVRKPSIQHEVELILRAVLEPTKAIHATIE